MVALKESVAWGRGLCVVSQPLREGMYCRVIVVACTTAIEAIHANPASVAVAVERHLGFARLYVRIDRMGTVLHVAEIRG